MPKMNSNIGLEASLHSRYIFNINLQNDFRMYAKHCKRLLEEDSTPGLIMIGCGKAITRMIKIAQICISYFQGLHMLNTFRFVKCRTCESKRLDTINQETETSVLANPTLNYGVAKFMKIKPQADGNWCPTDPISHKCKVANTFPLLLVHTLRISKSHEFVTRGATPEQIAIGYQAPPTKKDE